MREDYCGAQRLFDRSVDRRYQHQRQRFVKKVSTHTHLIQIRKQNETNYENILFVFQRCSSDYLQIADAANIHTLCGTDRKMFKDELCSNSITLTYLTNAKSTFLTNYVGFKAYFESN